MMRNSIVVLILLSPVGFVEAAPNDIDDLFRGGGGIVVDHQPTQAGGGASDTDFIDIAGHQSWQQVADDFVLPSVANIRRMTWWGFYGHSFTQDHDPPTGPETMRIRFYGARAGDGLPDDTNILFEHAFLNPTRIWTGRIIGVGGLPKEYFFEVDLPSPVPLDADTPYWLEVVQVGDVDSHFRWEAAVADMNGFAFVNDIVSDWQSTVPNLMGDTAFQLSTIPEPSAFVLFVSGALILHRSSRRRIAR